MSFSGRVVHRETTQGISWGYVIELGADPGTGRRVRQVRRGFPTRMEAEAELRRELVDLESGLQVDRSLMTVGDYLLGEWLPAHAQQIRGNTLDSYRSAISCHIAPHIGALRLQQVGPRDLNRLYQTLGESGSQSGGPLSPKTIRNAHVVLRRAFEDAVRWGLLRRNPVAAASPPSNGGRGRVPDPWQRHELLRFLRYVEGTPHEALWFVAGTTGMRRSEILGLRWMDVDLASGRLSVVQTVVLVKGSPQLGRPKTKRSARRVHLDERTVAALGRLRSREGEVAPDDALIFTRDGRPLRPDWVTNRFRRLCQEAGLRRVRLHDLRHAWATLALEEGINPKIVSDQLGHADVSITLDTYSHVLPSLQAEAVARVSDAIWQADHPSLPNLRIVGG